MITKTVKEALVEANELLRLGSLDQALNLALQIQKAVPKHSAANVLLAKCWLNYGNAQDAQKLVDGVLQENPKDLAALRIQALIYSQLNNYQAAISCTKRILMLDKKNVSAIALAANFFLELGDYNRALSFATKALEIDPTHISAYEVKSLLPGFRLDDDELKFLEKRMESKSFDTYQLVNLYFVLARHYEGSGDIERQVDSLRKGNELKATLTESVKWMDSFFDLAIQKMCYESLVRKSISTDSVGGQNLIFIVGFPRSGSTLTEQILAAHSQVESIGEKDFISSLINKMIIEDVLAEHSLDWLSQAPKSLIENIREQYYSMVEPFSGSGVILDKTLSNFFYIGLIKILFPKAKIIHTHKLPMETVLGCYKQKFSGNNWPFIYDFERLSNAYKAYHRLMEYWDDEFKGELYHLSYEKLVSDQKHEMQLLIDYCELDWEEQCLHFWKESGGVRTASLVQVRNGLNTKAIGRWKRYSEYLPELHAVEAPGLRWVFEDSKLI